MNRSSLLLVFALVACDKGSKSENFTAIGAPSATATSVVAKAAPSAEPTRTTAFAGNFNSTPKKSSTTKKEGSPSGWEKDDGSKFAGTGTIQLSIAKDGSVEGSLKGALGDQTLHGQLEGDELRASLVVTGTDVTQIQNGFLILKREGNGWKGKLTCASGDALLLREALVELTQSTG